MQPINSYNNLNAFSSSSSSSSSSSREGLPSDALVSNDQPVQPSNTLLSLRSISSHSWVGHTGQWAASFLRDVPGMLAQWTKPKTFNFADLPDEFGADILDFLEKNDLRKLKVIKNRSIRRELNTACYRACRRESFFPESLPKGITYIPFFLNRFPDVIGPKFWREYIGNVEDVPPIPREYIEMKPDFSRGVELVYRPEYVTIEVGAESPLMLEERAAANDRQSRLIEDPAKAPREARKIRVPVNENNIVLLTQKYLKKSFPTSYFEATQWKAVCEFPLHWSYQHWPINPPPEVPPPLIEYFQTMISFANEMIYESVRNLKSG